MWFYISISLIVVAVYLLACGVFYLIQERFIFHPEVLPLDFKYRFEYPFQEVFLTPEEGVRVNGLLFQLPESKGVVFYFKGNTRSIKGWSKFARDFLGKGYDFFMIDYRGFGKSRGKRTEAAIHNDGQYAYEYLRTLYPEKEIIIYGRSMGSGFATKVAAGNTPKMLLLDSPYFSFLHIAKRYGFLLPISRLLKYHIRTDQYIQGVDCPVYVMHGTKDRLIPARSGERLANMASRGEFIPIEDAGHNNLPRFAAYHDHLYSILHDQPRTYVFNGGMETSYS